MACKSPPTIIKLPGTTLQLVFEHFVITQAWGSLGQQWRECILDLSAWHFAHLTLNLECGVQGNALSDLEISLNGGQHGGEFHLAQLCSRLVQQ